jgi:tetratricopeptide (TPR) repeat protein
MAVASRSQIKYWSNNYTLFTRAENIAPENVEAKLNLINELFHRQQYGAVLKLAKEAQQLDPKSLPAFSAAGQAAYLLHDYQAAETYYARATELDPGRGDLFYCLGQARMQMEENDSAADALKRAVALAPASRGFHYMLGKALMAVGDRASAREQFQQELLVDPQSWAAHAALQQTELRPKASKLLTSVRPQNLDPVSK